MASVYDTITWLDNETELKISLGIDLADASEDAQLQWWLKVATRAADLYLNNTFTDADGNDITIPEIINEGVYAYIQVLRQRQLRTDGIQAIKTHVMAETFGDSNAQKGKAALNAAIPFWDSCKLEYDA